MGDVTAVHACKDCGDVIPTASRNGHWPQRCPECKAEQGRRRAARWREENLERARATSRAWHQKDPVRSRAGVRQWQLDNPDRVAAYRANYTADQTRNWYLRSAYGITLEEQHEMRARQGGMCLICAVSLTPENLAVDHDHLTGEVRGLLCRECNRSLSKAERDPMWLLVAFSYLTAEHRPWLAQGF